MRRSLWLAVLVAAPAVACSPRPSGPGPNPVQVTVVGTPSLVAYRDGTGDWIDLTSANDAGAWAGGNYTLGVGYDYTLLVTCSDATGFDTELRARTTDDADPFIYCDGHATALPGAVQVTGQMSQAGTVSMYDTAQGTTAPWSYALAVPPGTRDLLAVGADSAAIRHDLVIADGAQLPALDLAKEGQPLVPLALALDGVGASDRVTTELDLYSANNLAWGPTAQGTTVQMYAPSLLHPNDQVDLYLTDATPAGAGAVRYNRTLDAWFDGSTTHFTLPPLLTQVFFDDAGGVTWNTLPPHDYVALELSTGTDQVYSAEKVSASQTWLDATGATQLSLAAFGQLPARFQDAWTVDPSHPHTRTFRSGEESPADIVSSTALSEDVGPPQPRRAPRPGRYWSGASRKILP